MRRVSIALLALAVVAAACATEEEPAAEPTTTTEATATTSEPTTTTEATATTTEPTTTTEAAVSTDESAVSGPSLTLASSDLGDILVDASGKTLYLFMPDAQGESTCYDQCEAAWPPLTGQVSAGDGVDASLLGTVPRTDGSIQVTYNGWPLYSFAADSAPGDTNGQGVNDVWFVVDAAGEAVG